MMRMFFLALMFASVAEAQTFVLTGALDDGDSQADGVFSFELAILGTDGLALWSEVQPAVVVVAGAFAIDVGAATPLPGGIPAPATLRVTIEGDEMPPFRLASLLRASSAAVADRATTAVEADTLAGVSEVEAVTVTALSGAGGSRAPFSAVTDLPVGVADGDNGVDALPGRGLALASRRLTVINPADAALFADGSIDASRISGAVPAAAVANGAITGAKVATNLTRGNLTGVPVETSFAGRDLFVDAQGCSNRSELTTATSCAAATCTASGGAPGFVGCNGTGCSASNPSTCQTSRVGTLVAP